MAAWYLSFTVSLGSEPLVQALSVHQSASAEDPSDAAVEAGLSVTIDAAPSLRAMTEDLATGHVQLGAPRFIAGDGVAHPVDLLNGDGSNQSGAQVLDLEQASQQASADPPGAGEGSDRPSPEILPGLETVADQLLGPSEAEASALKTMGAARRAEDSGEQQTSAALRKGAPPADAVLPSLTYEPPSAGSHDVMGFDPSGTQQSANELFQFADGEAGARDNFGEQGADQRSGAAVPASGRLSGETGFGETIAAQHVGERGLLPDGSGHRSAANGQAGRPGTSPAWPTGNERTPLIQTVSLDLEPADLGPLNVRIFMMDRTVHAHIRTEHADLGQGMLAQQHHLEVKLQHSGLEMGELRVTVDQQPLTRDDAQGWLRQQSERRPVVDHPEPRGLEQEDRNATVVQSRRSGLMSLFA